MDFLNWAENKNISFYDIQKMPPVIFNALINQYIDTHSLKNIINAKNFIQGYCKGGITPKPFEDVFKRYNAPDVWKCVFLPQKANNILPEFIKKYYDDLKYASRDYLDIFFNKRDLKRTGHLLKYEIKGFDTIPASAIPCIVLWHTDIFQFKYYTFKSYTLDELYTLLIHIIDVIAQGNNDTDVFMEAERMANDISTRHLLNGTTNPHSVTNINVSNSTIGNSLIAGNNDSDVSVVCVKNDNMLNDEISKIVTKINTLDELQQEQKELLSEILENLKNPEKQNESKNIFKGILMGLGSVAAKVKAIITAYPKVAEFLNLN